MPLDNIAINSFYKKHSAIIKIAGVFAVLVIIGLIFTYCQQRASNQFIEDGKANINANRKQIENLNAERSNQNIANAVQAERVNQARNNYENAKKKSNRAKQNTNSALDRVNNTNSRDFSNVRPNSNKSKRCEAFPESADCRGRNY